MRALKAQGAYATHPLKYVRFSAPLLLWGTAYRDAQTAEMGDNSGPYTTTFAARTLTLVGDVVIVNDKRVLAAGTIESYELADVNALGLESDS